MWLGKSVCDRRKPGREEQPKEVLKGADSYLQTILKMATRTRSTAILGAIDSHRAVQAAFAHIRVYAGRLFHSGVQPDTIARELEEGVREYASKRAATLKKAYAAHRMKASFSDDFGKASKPISHMATAVGAAFTLYDIGSFVKTVVDKDKDVSLKEIESLTKALHGGGLTLGEELFGALRIGQAAISVLGGTLAVTVGIAAVPVVGTLVAAGIVLTGATIEILKSARKGIENTIKDTRKELNRLPLFDGKVQTFSEDSRYVLYNALTIVQMGDETYHKLTDTLRKWKSLSQLDESVSYWNMHMIKAGSVLIEEGYSAEQVMYICMEEAGEPTQVENDWIRWFAENETFKENGSRKYYTGRLTAAKDAEGEPLYEKSFQQRGDRLEIVALPPKMSMDGLFG